VPWCLKRADQSRRPMGDGTAAQIGIEIRLAFLPQNCALAKGSLRARAMRVPCCRARQKNPTAEKPSAARAEPAKLRLSLVAAHAELGDRLSSNPALPPGCFASRGSCLYELTGLALANVVAQLNSRA